MSSREENLEKVKELQSQVKQGNNLQKEIHVDFESRSGNHYKGTVVVHRPSIGEHMKIGAEKARILETYAQEHGLRFISSIDAEMQMLANIMATLKFVVDQKPDWLTDFESMYDYDVLIHVYNQYTVWLENFRNPSDELQNGDSEE